MVSWIDNIIDVYYDIAIIDIITIENWNEYHFMAPLRGYSNKLFFVVVYKENNLQWYVNDVTVFQTY